MDAVCQDSPHMQPESNLQSVFVIGKATFKTQCQMDRVRSMLNPEMEQILEEEVWKLSERFDETWSSIFASMQSITNKTLWLDWNKQSCILKDMVHVDFSHLLVLSLDKNNISSIEPLSRINAANLERLFIFDNNIVHVRTLRKTHFCKLNSLKLEKNKVGEVGILSAMQLSEHVNRLSLEFWHDERVQGEDGSILVKLAANDIEYVWCNAWRRLTQKKTKKMAKRRYPNSNVVGLGR